MNTSSPEGNDTSVFAYGSDGSGGCDLSPFGGMLFSCLGQGARGATPFTDSLYFRPQDLLGVTAPGQLAYKTTGEVFNKGMISFWYRTPSGAKENVGALTGTHPPEKRMLFHLTLWEKAKLGSDATAAAIVSPVTRPTIITCYLQDWDSKLNFCVAGNIPDVSPSAIKSSYSNTIDLLETPYPTDPSDLATKKLMGIPPLDTLLLSTTPQMYDYSLKVIGTNTAFRRWFLGPHPTNPSAYKQSFYSSVSNHLPTDYGYTQRSFPGTWNRVVVRWDLSDANDETPLMQSLRLKAQLNGVSSIAKVNLPTQNWLAASFNRQMMLSFGQLPALIYNSYESGAGPYPFMPPLTTFTYYPFYRLHSSIDNIDVRFGDSGPVDVESVAGYETRRYNISNAYEPGWVIDPGMLDGPVVALGARIYDVPDMRGCLNTDPDLRSPAVEIDLAESGSAIGGSELFYESPQRPQQSKALKCYTPRNRDDLRFWLRYVNRDPSGVTLGPKLHDIPYILDVSWCVLRREPKIIQWSQDAGN
ncbi:MAG: hypothetical protein AB7F75_03125 [Planctomycetota bacterium]